MSIKVFTIISFMVLLSSLGNVQGHSPSAMTLEYDDVNDKLTITITHSVSDPSSHFVNGIEIDVNGSSEITEKKFEQPGSSS